MWWASLSAAASCRASRLRVLAVTSGLFHMGGMLPFSLTICGEAEITRSLDGHTHALSIMDPGLTAVVDLPEARILRLNFHDLDRAPRPDDPLLDALRRSGQTLVLPAERHVRAILEFGTRLGRGDSLLIHCMAGISRSTAAAWMIGAQAFPGREHDILSHIRRIRPQAMPNRLMVAIADSILGAEGRMIGLRG